MRLRSPLWIPLLLSAAALVVCIPAPDPEQALSEPKEDVDDYYDNEEIPADDYPFEDRNAYVPDPIDDDEWWQDVTSRPLEKRRGGGGRGGSSGGGGRSGGSSSGSSGSSGRGSGSSSSTSNNGGRTSSGSGTPKTFGSGSSRSYSGGAAVPYTAGRRSPSGILPFFLPLAAIAFFAGPWLFACHAYNYHNPVTALNRTSDQNETLPLLCLCQEYSVCGCDENHNASYVQALWDNATSTVNGSVARIADVNGTRTLIVNGTQSNGTTAEGAAAMLGVGAGTEVLGLAALIGCAVLLL